MRTNSQTSLQNTTTTNPLYEQTNSKNNTIHSSVKTPNKNKLNPNSTTGNETDYNLLIKLKDYIEELKTNEQKYIDKISHLEKKLK